MFDENKKLFVKKFVKIVSILKTWINVAFHASYIGDLRISSTPLLHGRDTSQDFHIHRLPILILCADTLLFRRSRQAWTLFSRSGVTCYTTGRLLSLLHHLIHYLLLCHLRWFQNLNYPCPKILYSFEQVRLQFILALNSKQKKMYENHIDLDSEVYSRVSVTSNENFATKYIKFLKFF